MKTLNWASQTWRGMTLAVAFILSFCCATMAQLPTANQVAGEMTIGWNLGNSLEVPGSETGWGNPPATQQLINQVKSAGFNVLRLPCAWDSYADQSTFQIDASWLARVKEVVDYGISNDMYVIINSHWDGGWLEEHPLYSYQDAVNEKQEAYWTQIADYFKSYDEHLLFAGTNEVRANYSTPTSENIEVQESYNQTFVNAVRATGGNNSTRTLIVQTYNTNIWFGLDYFTLPQDPTSNRLMVEVHHYDPYDFTLNPDNNAACTVWGQPWVGGDVCSWGQEDYTEDLFDRVEQEWVVNNVPVIIGEFGVAKRTALSGTALSDHLAAREYYLEYMTDASSRNGIVPIYWDNGYSGDMGFALFDRNSAAIVDQGALDALLEGVDGGGGGNPDMTYTVSVNTVGQGVVSLSPSGGVYEAGTSITVSAQAANGWSFDAWSGALSGSSNPTMLTIDGDMSITANFSENDNGGGSGCSSPISISTPFAHDGAGDYCWFTTGPISYINSWALDELLINGVDYTNTWSNSMPPAVDGGWTIQYSGSFGWSHFEAAAPSNSGRQGENGDQAAVSMMYPNPFHHQLKVQLNEPDQTLYLVVRDISGRFISRYEVGGVKGQIEIGVDLKPGQHILEIIKMSGKKSYKIVKSN
ncbi:cellulase family glycosylhydrolase [Fulvivirga ligni]|uniref:cellulase family glycosylhydrolase n=1 Tax=Fulvivirga ligni TaxID=2904246 RepID=UPI001F26CA3D|nr:cellulase family glycosylhydrolase [Fulvivirga ligni]UII23919.1 cellulase family glycosylhydrolase [Fulvivirga ligni]